MISYAAAFVLCAAFEVPILGLEAIILGGGGGGKSALAGQPSAAGLEVPASTLRRPADSPRRFAIEDGN